MAANTVSAPVCPVVGENLLIERAGRRLLTVPMVRLGDYACTSIVGPNGAGKSLLVRTLCALQRADEGKVWWGEHAPDQARRHRVGLLLQRPVLLMRSALENVSYALRIAGSSQRLARQQAEAALQVAGLTTIMHSPAARLSGGEQQRLALARALALKPDMLFMDESTAHVDQASTLAIEQQLKEAMDAGLRLVLISHDVGQVQRLADEIVLMHNGEIVEQNGREAFFEHSINPVTRKWLNGDLLV